jgi:hypothetical protein
MAGLTVFHVETGRNRLWQAGADDADAEAVSRFLIQHDVWSSERRSSTVKPHCRVRLDHVRKTEPFHSPCGFMVSRWSASCVDLKENRD